MKLIADHPLLAYIEDGFAESDSEGFRSFNRSLRRKYPHVKTGMNFKSVEHLHAVTLWEPLTEEEREQWVEKC